jgi:class 3 adenylate cyclase
MASSDSEPAAPGHDRAQRPQTKRRSLRAVFAADLAGFSGQMAANETGTVKSLNEVRVITVKLLEEHEGWLFGMPGDGLFALFESAVSAVRCALETQRQLALRTNGEDLRLRIGIHLGEVLFENELPYGEALTIAARLEALADPGGILVSGAVMDVVAPRVSATFEERGVPRLKNVPRRIVTFAVTPPPERTSIDETNAGRSHLDRTTQLDRNTLSMIREQTSARLMPGHGANSADKVDTKQPENDQEFQSSAKTTVAPVESDLSDKAAAGNALAQSAPKKSDASSIAAAAPPPPVEVERPVDRASTSQSVEPKTKPVDGAALASGTTPQPGPISAERPSPECVESLTAALAVHLGPLAKVLIDRCLKDSSSAEQLVSSLMEYIPNDNERFLFRVRASHICMTFSRAGSSDARS